jgi:hypothetical protein
MRQAQEPCGEWKGLWVSYTVQQQKHAPGVRGARVREQRVQATSRAWWITVEGVRKRLAHGRGVAAGWSRQSRRPWPRLGMKARVVWGRHRQRGKAQARQLDSDAMAAETDTAGVVRMWSTGKHVSGRQR